MKTQAMSYFSPHTGNNYDIAGEGRL